LGLGILVETAVLVSMRRLAGPAAGAFAHLIEKAPDYLEVLDAEGAVLYSSPSVKQLVGEAGAGRPLVHPDDRDRADRALAELREEPGRVRSLELRIVTPDGSVRHLEVTARNLLAEPIVRGIVVNARDVTDRVRSEQALRRSEERFRALVEESKDVIALLDGSGTILYSSPTRHRPLGMSPEELVGRSALEFIHPEDRPRFQALLEQVRAQPDAAGVEAFRARRRDGAWRWIEFSLGNLLDNPTVGALVANYRDVTERRSAEEATRKLSRVVEQMAEQVIVMDQDLRIEYVNPALEQATGYTAAELEGRPVTVFNSEQVAPERYADLRARVQAGRPFTAETVRRRKDGSTYHAEITVTFIRDAEGRSLHVLSTGRDVTERLRLQEEQERLRRDVEKAAEEWRLTFDSIESPVLVADPAGRVVRLNLAAQDLCDRPYDLARGQELKVLGPGEPWRTSAALASRVVGVRTAQGEEVRDPETGRTWEIAANLVGSPGREDRVIVVARDVTATIDLQETLRRSETMSALGSLVAGVAHEVRNPLFSLSANVDALEAELGAREDAGEIFRVLRSELRRLSDLMRDLLDYGRPPRLEIAPGSFDDVVAEAVRSTRALAEERHVTVRTPSLGGLVLPMDRRRLAQVFRNLIENALRHAPEGGWVQVEAKRGREGGRDTVVCSVADNGSGFCGEDLHRVFEPFFTRRPGGTGLGLSIVARIVDEHGGHVQARNRPEGGALVVVKLPLATAPGGRA
jgi:PAS domain S-box-containing protein